jgi:hypothetical protein
LDSQLRVVNIGDMELRRVLRRHSSFIKIKRRKSYCEIVDYEAYIGESSKPMTVRQYRGAALDVRDSFIQLKKWEMFLNTSRI